MADRDELMRRRGELVARSRALREQWGRDAAGLKPAFGVADSLRAGVDWLFRHPEWPIGALVVVAVVRPRRVLKLAGAMWTGYGVYRQVRRFVGAPRLRGGR